MDSTNSVKIKNQTGQKLTLLLLGGILGPFGLVYHHWGMGNSLPIVYSVVCQARAMKLASNRESLNKKGTQEFDAAIYDFNVTSY